MDVTIALLQGVNIGKYKRISMADFKAIITALGGENATTIANSGNIVFSHDRARIPDELRLAIETAVSDHAGVLIPTITRPGAEIQQVIANNPYPDVDNPKHLHVDLLLEPVEGVLNGIEFGQDHLTLIGRDLYMHLPNGVSGLTYDARTLNKRLGTHHTSRNWSTITKLANLARMTES